MSFRSDFGSRTGAETNHRDLRSKNKVSVPGKGYWLVSFYESRDTNHGAYRVLTKEGKHDGRKRQWPHPEL